MKKKWFYSATVLGVTAVLSIPLMGFSPVDGAHSYSHREDIDLKSGGIGVPIGQGPFSAQLYHEPTDGIITGAEGCQPDIHTFSKSAKGIFGPEHIVFTAGVKKVSTQAQANSFDAKGYKIYVQIFSEDQKVLEQAFYQHPTVDPNTQKPFWVSAVYFTGPNAVNLPTGEYEYKFVAKDKQGHIRDEWEPEHNKITITE